MDSYRGSLRYCFVVGFVAIISLMIVGCVSGVKRDVLTDDPALLEVVANSPQPEKKIENIEGGDPLEFGETREPAMMTAPEGPQALWTLANCIDYARDHNEKIHSLSEKAEGVQGQIIEAWSAYLPTGTFEYAHANSNETGDVDYFQIYGKTLVWDCGKTKSRVKKLEAEREMHRAAKQAQALDVVYNVKRAFYELLYTQYLVAARNAQVESAKVHEQGMQGAGRESDVLAAKATVAQGEQQVFESSNAYRLAKQRLNHYMGRDLNAALEIEGKLEVLQIPVDSDHRKKLVVRALSDNPDLKQLEQVIEQEKFSKEEARRYNYPNIHAFAFFEYRDTDKEFQFVDRSEKIFQGKAYGVGVDVELPLFQGLGLAYGKGKKADAMIKSAEKDFENARREVAYHIEAICNRMEEAIHGIGTRQISVQYHEKILDSVEGGLSGGDYQGKDVLEAKKNVANARVEWMQSILDYNVAKAELDRILGMLELAQSN